VINGAELVKESRELPGFNCQGHIRDERDSAISAKFWGYFSGSGSTFSSSRSSSQSGRG
jgi:hypothetical protein